MPIMLETDRARRAWERVREVCEKYKDREDVQKRYRSQVRGAPAMIQRNGLGQFLAFLAAGGFSGGELKPESKDAKDHADGLLYQHLGAWLLKAIGVQVNEPRTEDVKPTAEPDFDPLRFLMERATLEQTMWATREVLAFLQWARRFADSQLKEPDSQGR
jgi:CRISPR type III-B/RAMP module-associated protein Cmr5